MQPIPVILLLLFSSIATSVASQDVGPEDKVISIYFGGGSYYIDYDQEGDLIQFIEDVDYLEEYQVEVHGHTDNIGSREFNQYLSEMRSESVIQILSGLMIERERIFKYDHGEDNPTFSNDSLNGKLNNRRVDVILRKLPI